MQSPAIDGVSVLGLNHRSAPVEIRERVALAGPEAPEFLRLVVGSGNISEAAAVSTCNRVELYTLAKAPPLETARVIGLLASYHGLASGEIEPYVYRSDGPAAVRHLFRVAASLDSMVVGEKQILGQVKSAYFRAVEAGTVGCVFHKLFQCAFHTAKELRVCLDSPGRRMSVMQKRRGSS